MINEKISRGIESVATHGHSTSIIYINPKLTLNPKINPGSYVNNINQKDPLKTLFYNAMHKE
jgi:hypothetical protein